MLELRCSVEAVLGKQQAAAGDFGSCSSRLDVTMPIAPRSEQVSAHAGRVTLGELEQFDRETSDRHCTFG